MNERTRKCAIWLRKIPFIPKYVVSCISGSLFYVFLLWLDILKTGGYHARYWWLCIVISSTVLGTALYIQDYVEMNSRLTACVLISAILLILFSPVESSNRKLDNDERIWFRKMVLAIETVAFIIYLLLICNNFSQTAIAFGIGMIIPLIMQIPCYITKIIHLLLMIKNLKKP